MLVADESNKRRQADADHRTPRWCSESLRRNGLTDALKRLGADHRARARVLQAVVAGTVDPEWLRRAVWFPSKTKNGGPQLPPNPQVADLRDRAQWELTKIYTPRHP